MSNSKIQVGKTAAHHVFTENQTRFPNLLCYIKKQIILTEKTQLASIWFFQWFLICFMFFRENVKNTKIQKTNIWVVIVKINNEGGFHLTATKHVCTPKQFQIFYKSNNKWHHTYVLHNFNINSLFYPYLRVSYSLIINNNFKTFLVLVNYEVVSQKFSTTLSAGRHQHTPVINKKKSKFILKSDSVFGCLQSF